MQVDVGKNIKEEHSRPENGCAKSLMVTLFFQSEEVYNKVVQVLTMCIQSV